MNGDAKPPVGDGKPDCPDCEGVGGTYVYPDVGPPYFVTCGCVKQRDILDNMERGWKNLSKVGGVSSTPLLKRIEDDLWLTTDHRTFQKHLKAVVQDQPSDWFFKVETDNSLIAAWLASVLVKGQEVFDADAYRETSKYFALEDLVRPPDLLVLVLGIKTAANKEMSAVFAESIQDRMHNGKPTWIVDSPEKPLNSSHMCWSDSLEETLDQWEILTLRSLVRRSPVAGRRHPLPPGVRDTTHAVPEEEEEAYQQPSSSSSSPQKGRSGTSSHLNMLKDNEAAPDKKKGKNWGGKKR